MCHWLHTGKQRGILTPIDTAMTPHVRSARSTMLVGLENVWRGRPIAYGLAAILVMTSYWGACQCRRMICEGTYYSKPKCVDQPDGYVCECGPGFDWNTHLCISTAVDSSFQFTKDAYSSLLINSETDLNEFTIAAWLNLANVVDEMAILVYSPVDDHETILEVTLNISTVHLKMFGQDPVDTNVKVEPAVWFHLTCTWIGEDEEGVNKWTIYVNSKLAQTGFISSNVSVIQSRGRMMLGRYPLPATNTAGGQDNATSENSIRYKGQMAHVHVWSYAMNLTEIQALYNDCFFVTCGDVVEWTQFREGTRGQMRMKWPSGVSTKKCFTIKEAAKTCDRYCSLVIGAQCNEQVLENIVWTRTPADHVASIPCPGQTVQPGATNTYANRSCLKTDDLDGAWDTPVVDDCISKPVLDVQQEVSAYINDGLSLMESNRVLELTRKLKNHTRNEYLSNPIDISAITHALDALIRLQESNVVDESWMKGLTRYARTKQTYPNYEQIATFSKSFITILDNIISPSNSRSWVEVRPQGSEGDKMMQVVEDFIGLVSRTLLHHVKVGIISHNQAFVTVKRKLIALKIKTHPSSSIIGVAFPDNQDEVNMKMGYWQGTVALPKEALVDAMNTYGPEHVVVASVRLKILNDFLPNHNLSSQSKEDNVNSLLFGTFVYLDDGTQVTNLSAPVKIHLPYRSTFNISNPECVYLRHGNRSRPWGWSTDSCHLVEAKPKYATCACSRPGIFTVTTDMYDDNWDKGEEPNVLMEIPSYVGCSISTILCLLSLIMLIYLRTSSNTADIHKNFSTAIILGQLCFMFGIDRIHHKVVCDIFAIALHYFVLAGFSWLMNEAFNLYIVITYAAHSHGEHTESSMWRYYILGWILPGVLVGAFVGTHTENYYARDMCWIAWEHIWLFAGPIVGIISIIILVLTFTAKEHHESSYTKNEKANKVILIHTKALWTQVILLTLMWTFAFISILMRGIIVKYLFALFDVLQGAFFLVFYFLLNDEVRTMYKAHRKKKSLALQGYDFSGNPEREESDSDEESSLAAQGAHGSGDNSVRMNVRNRNTNARKRSEIEASSDEESDCEMVTSV